MLICGTGSEMSHSAILYSAFLSPAIDSFIHHPAGSAHAVSLTESLDHQGLALPHPTCAKLPKQEGKIKLNLIKEIDSVDIAAGSTSAAKNKEGRCAGLD